MVGHEDRPPAVPQRHPVPAIEVADFGLDATRGGGPSESTTELGDDPREPQRVEPDVWIHIVAAGVDRWAAPIRDRVLDGGLESAGEIHDDVGVADLLHVARRELDVVRLRTCRRHVDDAIAITGDPLRGPGKGIERRDDRGPCVRLAARATGRDEQRREESEGEDAHGGDGSTQ